MKPIRVIGHGAFGYVYEILDRNRNCKAALKRTQKAGDVVSREFEMLNMLIGKQNVIQMLDFFYTQDDHGRLI